MSTEYLTVKTTLPSLEHAQTIAEALVEDHLAACVQVSAPITSYYRWEGKLKTATEFELTAKTTVAVYDKLLAKIVDHHPYDIPQILATPIVNGQAEYLTWLKSEVSPREP